MGFQNDKVFYYTTNRVNLINNMYFKSLQYKKYMLIYYYLNLYYNIGIFHLLCLVPTIHPYLTV